MFNKRTFSMIGMAIQTLAERVAKAINASGKTPAGIAREIGVSPAAVYQWIQGGIKDLRNENLFALADATGFSARWLGTGDGPMVDRYGSPAVKHVMEVMENLPPAEQAKLARLADAFTEPPANDLPPHASVQQRKVGG